LGRPPADAMDGATPRRPVGAPEGVGSDGDATLLPDRVYGGGRRHPRTYSLFHEQAENVTVPAGDLLADDHVWGSAQWRCVVGSSERALDRVVVRDSDDIEIAQRDKVIDHGAGAGPAVAVARVNMEVRSAEPGHLQRWYRSAKWDAPGAALLANLFQM